ncbi:MAG: MurR/RpiR family transcriptional regulator [Phyllobacteriaceae bacterium]|nr:MurR/RpiR family transcriptional regulator [Phyllobacteriaceae bacterium]
MLKSILTKRSDMGAAEQRVADYVSTHPEQVMQMSMAELSGNASVSDPTIMRFCRRLGYEGYQDFKLNLAQTLVPSAPFEYEQITARDSIENVVRKTCRNSLNAIQRAQDDLVPSQIAAAGTALAKASWIGIYATGISDITSFDAEHKFQRLGLRCAALIGRKKQWMHAEQARPGEVALIFSQSGATKQMVEVAIAVKAGGGKVIAVTAADSPLARQADSLVAVRPYDQTEVMTPLASRLNHHLVVNMLVTAIAVSKGSEFPDQLPALDSWQTEKI